MCHSKSRATGAKNPLIMGNMARISAHHRKMKMLSVETLNLRGSISFQNSEQPTNLPISLTEADINTISAVDNTWLEFFASPTINYGIQKNPNDSIILTKAEDDCDGIFISNKTRKNFEIEELQKRK